MTQVFFMARKKSSFGSDSSTTANVVCAEENRRKSSAAIQCTFKQRPLFDQCKAASSPSSPHSKRKIASRPGGESASSFDRWSPASFVGQAVMVLFNGSKTSSSASASPSQRHRASVASTGTANLPGKNSRGHGLTVATGSMYTPKTNPIAQLYEIGDQIGSGGLGMMWRIYGAVKISTREESSVFFFDKSQSVKVPTKCQRSGRATLTELMRYDSMQLQNIRHSRVLQIMEPLKENSESLAFASEPILGSLSDLLMASSNQGDQTPSDGEPFRLEEMEIKCGILQIAEALAFLHSGAGWIHMSVCPENIYVTKWGSWKLAGFSFAEKLLNGLNRASNVRWTPTKPGKPISRVQPDLNFLAPECPTELECTPASDIFSLAITICTIYNGNIPLIDCNQNLETYNRHVSELDRKVAALNADMGPNLTEAILKMLASDVKQRPSAQLFLLISFFNDQGMLCLRLLEDVQYADTVQKVQFYCSQLKESLCLIPEKLWFTRILPRLKHELKISPDLASAIVKPLMYMLQHCSDDHVHYLKPVFKKLITAAKLEHAMLLSNLMENIEMVMKRVPEIQTPIVQLVLNSTKAYGNVQAQDSAVSCLPKMKPFLTMEYVESKLYPILKEMFANASIQLQTRTLESMSQMLSLTTDKAIVDYLQFLSTCRFDDAQVINALSKFYDVLILETTNLSIPADFIATIVLPSFAPLIAVKALNQQQLTNVIQTCRILVDYMADKKLDSLEPRRALSNHQRSETFLQVPFSGSTVANVRPQRHSITGGCLPQVMITSPSSPQKGSVEKRRDSSMDSVRTQYSERKFSTSAPTAATGLGVGHYLGSDNFLTAPRSHPSSPHQRRHSVTTVPARPNSFTNLSHNIACMLSWKKT